MTLFQSARALLTTLLTVILVAGLAACGGTGGESDTDAPLLELNPVPVSTLERTRTLSGKVEAGAQVEVSSDKDPLDKAAKDKQAAVVGENWSYSLNLVPGVNTISVKATDATGNNKTLVFPLTYDVVTLDVELLSTSVQGQTLSGTVATGGSFSGTLTISGGTTVVQNIPTITAANWTHTLETLDPGTYNLTLTATDDIAQPPTRTQTLTRTLVIDSSLPTLTVNPASAVGATVAVSGTVATDATISEVRLNGKVVPATVTQDAGSGTWSVTLTNLETMRNQIDVTATLTANPEKKGTARLFVLYQP